MVKLYTFIILLLFSSFIVHSQCAEEQTFVVCDMIIVDGDNDGTPDGVINLYDELSTIIGTTLTVADGIWFDPNFTFALDSNSGDLFLWDLPDSSEAITDYQFEFLDTSSGCPNDVRYLFNIVLGPYSGDAASTLDGSINLQVCQGAPPFECGENTSIDLFQTMLSNPSPHGNGVWVYTGVSPNFVGISDNRFLNVNVPYQEGPPLVDEEIFPLEYRVPGIAPCDPEQVTAVSVAVTREPFAGFANEFVICETELLAGDFDLNIDLRDDAYLVNENIEGIWLSDPTGQISGPGDSVINLREIYDDLVATTPEFGCMTYEFTYFVESRSSICTDQQSTISFTFYEFIRPFTQNVIPEVCVGDPTNTTLDLYDFIDFTTEGTALFDYPLDACTNWTFISGPSDLNIVPNTGDICSLLDDPEYTSDGTIDISGLLDNTAAGTYVFEFTVDASYHCPAGMTTIFDVPDGCGSTTSIVQPCSSQTATVTLIVNPMGYAGEDTAGLEFCETEGTLTLTDLLETNGVDTVDMDGIWTDLDSSTVIPNDYTIPEIATGSQIFNFEYNVTTIDGCEDSATLTFTIYQQFDPGESVSIALCDSGSEVDLFTFLGGTPDINGSWTGPNGYTSATNVALFDPSVNVGGDYIYTVPENVTCPSVQAIVTVSLEEADYAGEDTMNVEVCENLGSVDLLTLITTNGIDTITTGGVFTDTSGNVVVNPFVFPTNVIDQQSLSFIYTTPGSGGVGCQDEATLSIILFEQFNAGIGTSVQVCTDGTAVLDLFPLLTGMPDTNGTWSGPDGFTTTDNLATFDPAVNTPGSYIYTVPENGACMVSTATVIIDFFAVNYAGEDTTGVQICEDIGSVDLTTLLETNGVDTVFTGPEGIWTDGAGNIIANPFTIPTINGSQTFNLTYTTTTVNGCTDQSTLSFTVFEQNDSGTGTSIQFCENEGVINLFDLLAGAPDNNGSWTGPGGYTATGATATIDLSSGESGDYIYTIASNGACDESTATISVIIFENSNAGNDVDTFVCPGDLTVELLTLLDANVTPNGEFIDLSNNQVVPSGIVDVGLLGEGTFSYVYIVSNGTCPEDDALLTFTITAVATPTVSDTADFYCVNDGITLGDLIVNGTNEFAWFASADGGDELPLSTLLVDGVTYFVAALDNNGCESTRIPYTAEILPLSDGRCQIEISDGVSDNGDGVNDDLDLGSLPDIFPNFDIQIFNRYGTIVYRGNRGTEFFDGRSNTGSGIGDQLPTGVYFYIFYPNEEDTSPIDGNFYLSR